MERTVKYKENEMITSRDKNQDERWNYMKRIPANQCQTLIHQQTTCRHMLHTLRSRPRLLQLRRCLSNCFFLLNSAGQFAHWIILLTRPADVPRFLLELRILRWISGTSRSPEFGFSTFLCAESRCTRRNSSVVNQRSHWSHGNKRPCASFSRLQLVETFCDWRRFLVEDGRCSVKSGVLG